MWCDSSFSGKQFRRLKDIIFTGDNWPQARFTASVHHARANFFLSFLGAICRTSNMQQIYHCIRYQCDFLSFLCDLIEEAVAGVHLHT